MQRLRPIGEEVAEASRRIHEELGPCRRCQVENFNLSKFLFYFTYYKFFDYLFLKSALVFLNGSFRSMSFIFVSNFAALTVLILLMRNTYSRQAVLPQLSAKNE